MNIKVLRVAYNQYFCNMSIITDEDLLNIHYIVNEKLSKDEDIDSWEDLHKDLLIWQPFENAPPSDIIDNIDALIADINENLLPDSQSFITINKLELASNIAEDLTKQEFERRHENFEIYEDNGDVRYTEEAQDFFNYSYGYYLTKIEDCV